MKKILVAVLLMIASAGECAWTQGSIPKSQINKSSTTTTTDTSSKKTSTTSTSSGNSTTSTSSTTSRATGTIAGHEYVDLGLSVKWATCNVGASSPEDYGDYYAWGETSTKLSYDIDNCETWGKEIDDIGGTSRDVAHVKWGGSWRMPTETEFDELCNSDNCTWEWTSQGGHKGYKVTSKKNGNSIFLPAAGRRHGPSLDYRGERGRCWSSSPDESDTQYAFDLYFNSGYLLGTDWGYRYYGHTVRPVAEFMIASAGECAWIQGAISKSQINKSSTTTTTDTSSKKTSTTSTSSGKSTTSTSSTTSRATGTIAGHEYVDLGLSVKWATCNVGASSPEDYGDYYAWGETSTKSSYYEENSETWEKEIGDIGGTSRDVAHVKWGGSWRMPTEAEFEELSDSDNCTWTWTTQSGHKGYKVTSRKNGNSIFLPAAGNCCGTSRLGTNAWGDYWSSTTYEDNTHYAYYLVFYSSDHDTDSSYRNFGHTVRPVAESGYESRKSSVTISEGQETRLEGSLSRQTTVAAASSSGGSSSSGASGTHNGYGYVDLGLPSGLKWATCNVGASSPEDYGDYYAWGETNTKSSYDKENCETWNKSIGDIKGTSRDVAHVKWGGSWRMPTKAEFEELSDSDNCTWTWITQGSHEGYKVTSRKNGNSIFLPAASMCIGTSLEDTGTWGDYWSSTPYEWFPEACRLYFFSSYYNTSWSFRYFGLSVRPVAEFMIASAGECAWTQGSIPKSQINKSSATTTTDTSSKKTSTTSTSSGKSTTSTSSTTSRVTGTIAGHEYVDLGLSVKWATCNVGANSPEDYGDYYAWGETSTKSSYDEDNCATYWESIGDIKNTSRDVAHVKWGGSWRMPTRAEFDELCNSDNCTWEWTSQGGHKGYKVTSKKNGNSIFLPAAGDRDETLLYDREEIGYYWSSTPDESDTEYAYSLDFDSSYHYTDWSLRDSGLTVRPVAE